jgi:predicted anti-sigma-YlaC factor YlaD
MEISCVEVRRELSNYIENDITPELRTRVEDHFLRCPGCKAVYDGVRNVIRLVGAGGVIELPEGFSRRLFTRLMAARAH